MKRRYRLIGSLAFLVVMLNVALAQNEPPILGGASIEFHDKASAIKVLSTEDEFLERLSPFDIQVRTRSTSANSVDAVTDFISQHVLEWSEEDRGQVTKAIEAMAPALEEYSPDSLDAISFIKTTGEEESNAAYTRGQTIVLTKAQLSMPLKPLSALIAHEWFHVMTRGEPALRDQLYKIVGFTKTNEIQLPSDLVPLKITNPDAPIIQHVIKIRIDPQQEVLVTPMLYARSEYDPAISTSLFDYLIFELVEVERNDADKFVCVTDDGSLKVHSVSNPDFQRQIGRNTGYIIHPEEILADNFSDLVVGRTDAPDIWITEKMRDLLSSQE